MQSRAAPGWRALAGAWPAGLAVGARRARRRGFPERAVRIVVPYSVGVGPDVVARSVAERLSQQWGQPVLVDNKPGASGIVAFGDVRRTPADGHTLYLADTATLAVNPLLHATLPYDPQRDLVPLTLLFRATFLILVGGGNRFRSVAELLDAARRKPGGVSYATLGNGHASHVAVETFARAAGVQMLHVPFKDAGTLLTGGGLGRRGLHRHRHEHRGRPGGQRQAAAAGGGGAAAPGQPPRHPDAGRSRRPARRDAPLGGAGGRGRHAGAGARAAAAATSSRALGTTEVRARAEQAGFEITPSTPQALRERIEADVALYAPLVARRPRRPHVGASR